MVARLVSADGFSVRRLIPVKFRFALLLSLLPAFVHAQTLLESARGNDPAAALQLIKGGADVRAKTSDGTTALHWAAHHGQLDVVTNCFEGNQRSVKPVLRG